MLLQGNEISRVLGLNPAQAIEETSINEWNGFGQASNKDS